jgi:hypothetical protein
MMMIIVHWPAIDTMARLWVTQNKNNRSSLYSDPDEFEPFITTFPVVSRFVCCI